MAADMQPDMDSDVKWDNFLGLNDHDLPIIDL